MQYPPRCRRQGPVRTLFAGRFVSKGACDSCGDCACRATVPAGSVYDLSIHGAGPIVRFWRGACRQPAAGWRIRVDGPLPGLANALPKFDLVLMPSLYEGLGLTAVESLWQEVPVVATAAPGST